VAPSWRRRFSPHYHWPTVPLAAIQEQLRRDFRRWGRPNRLRVDNGKPWGSWSDLPPVLALWLIGLGIDLVWNNPGRPQENGTVERSQGTAKRWAEPNRCGTIQELQTRLNDADTIQREEYPDRATSRLALHPQLRHGGRPYRRTQEAQTWDLGRVKNHLAGYLVKRRVDCQGKVSVYNRNRYVGTAHRGKTVWVGYEAESNHWLFVDATDCVLRELDADEVSTETICCLRVGEGK
jgi:hypothetical protein